MGSGMWRSFLIKTGLILFFIKIKLIGLARRMRQISLLRSIWDFYVQMRTLLLRALYHNGKYVRFNGGLVFIDFYDRNYIWYYKYNEFFRQETEAFRTLLEKRKPKVILDIGAHWGIFPSQLEIDESPLTSTIEKVICIEPDSSNLIKLKKTVEMIKRFKVDIVPFAISDKEDSIPMYKGTASCLHAYKGGASEYACTVNAAPLHIILRNMGVQLGDVTHIKLDIDGYEPAFFYGSTEFLKEHKPLLLAEFWARGLIDAGFDVKEYWEYLHSMYDVTEIVYPTNEYRTLSVGDLGYIREKTLNEITNLLLIPK